MLYIETKNAAVIFGVKTQILINSAYRNSQKYPYIRVDAGSRSRGGKRLLFLVEVAEIKSAYMGGKITKDERVYTFKDGELEAISVGDMFGEINFSGVGRVAGAMKNGDFGCGKGGVAGNSEISSGDNNTASLNLTNGLAFKNAKGSVLSGVADKAENLTYFQLSDKQKSEIDEKIKLIKAQEMSGLSVAKFCKDKGLSKTTFYRWKKEYESGGAVALADKSGMHRKGETKLEPWMQEFVLSKFRAYGAGNFNITECWDALHKEMMIRDGYDYISFLKCEVEPYCDVSVISRFLKNYYGDKKLEYTIITKGMDKAKSYFQPSMGNQREIVTKRNQCWQIDSSPLDVMAKHKGQVVRADILSIIDVYSGRCVADVVTQGNALTLIRLMWKALSLFGKPDYIKGDNGKDYLSKQFQGLLDGLNIYYDAAIAYAGDEKGFVERHFKTLQHAKISQLPGYIGFNLRIREQIEQRTAKKDRKAKDKDGNKKKTNLKYLLGLDEIRKLFESEVLKWDIVNVRRRGAISPIQKWNMDKDTELKKVEYSEFLLYAGAGDERSVQKGGIYYNCFNFVSFDMPSVRTPVIVRENIDDISEIFVFDMSGKFICVAVEESVAKLRADELNIITKEFKKEMRAIKKVIDRAEFSEFTKVNASYDLELMKKAHRESLEPEKWVEDESKKEIKEKIQKSRERNNINTKNGDYLNLTLPPKKSESKDKFISLDEYIENVI